MLPRRSWSLCLLLLLIAPGVCRAQDKEAPAPSPEASPAKIDPALEKKALDLLESLSDQISNLRSPSNRMRAECAVADLLWPRDEKRARALFSAAVAQLAARISDLDYADPDVYQELTRVIGARQDLILRIAVHDGEMALTALRQTRLPDDFGRRVAWNWQSENNLEMSVANLLARKDPGAALKLARSSLSRGLTINHISFLNQLYERDQKMAQAFHQEMVARIKDDDPGRTPDLLNLACNLVDSFSPPHADEDTFRDLLATVLGMVMGINRETQPGIGQAQNFYFQYERMKPLIEKYLPSRVDEVREWSQNVERTIDPQARMYQDLNRISQSGTVDDMLALAKKYPPEFQNLLYQNAAWKAFNDGDTARAKEIIDMMPDPAQRRQMKDALDNQTANTVEGNNKITEARRLTDNARSLSRKMDILIQLANSAVNENDKKTALDLLNQARTIANSSSQTAEQMTSLLRLAQAFLRVDPAQSFAILQPMIAKLNELVAAATMLDGIDFRYLRDGEWVMPGGNNLGTLVNLVDQTLAALGQTDFDRARALANQVDRPEMRLFMQIDLAQVTLGAKPPGPSIFGNRIVSMSGNGTITY